MWIEWVLAWIVTISGPAMLIVGGPAQIKRNDDMKRCGPPLIMIVLALVFHASNVGYGLCLHKIPVWLPSVAGVGFWVWITYQYAKYEVRKKGQVTDNETPDA